MLKQIPLIKSTFYHEAQTKKDLQKFIGRAKLLSFGEQCQLFEKNFAEYQERQYAIFVSNGSSANLAILQALLNLGRLRIGDQVAFSALTWSTNVMPIIQLGLKPVPIDVELQTLNVSSHQLQKILEKQKIKAVLLTNLLGFCDDIDEIKRICHQQKIILLEDNCESLGSVYKGQKLGNFSLASTFSFYVGHHLSTIEGGMVCTDDLDLATMLRIVRAHGWDRNLAEKEQAKIRLKYRVNSEFYARYTFYDLGFNMRPTEIAGFLGNSQLPYLPEILEKRSRNFLQIASQIYTLTDRYYPINYQHLDFVSNFAIPVVCKSVTIRDHLVKKCAQKIEIRPIVAGDITRQPFFMKHVLGYKKLPKNTNAAIINEQGLYLGNNPELTPKEIKTILQVLTN